MIRLENIHKQFGAQRVLCGIDLTFEKGTTTAIVGPSGTGKSVLVKIITSLLTPERGHVHFDGFELTGDIPTSKRQEAVSRMGILFQFAALFDSMNIFDNVAFPLRYGLRKASSKEIERRVVRVIEQVGMRGYELALPGEISIGMRKRIGVARALVTDPEVILFDEPNTGLDPTMGQEIYNLIRQTQQGSGLTGIVISHEIPEVFQVCERVVMLYGGKVQYDGDIEGFTTSTCPLVQQFISGSTEGPIQMN